MKRYMGRILVGEKRYSFEIMAHTFADACVLLNKVANSVFGEIIDLTEVEEVDTICRFCVGGKCTNSL